MFHLAIPTRNLEESEEFYSRLGAKIGRKYRTHVVINFFGHQLVCHLSEETPARATMYPRHFGICFESESRFFDYLQFCKVMIPELFFESYFARRVGEFAEHHTFFLADPSNNVIEFKWYKNNEAILG